MSDFDGIHKTDDGTEFPFIVTPDGERRILSCLPSPPDKEGLMKFGDAVGAVILPKSEWKVVDNRWLNIPILDQNGYSSCAGNATAGAVMRCRGLRGAALQVLSGSFLYSLNNGGRDSGANISACVKSAMDIGVALQSEVPESMIYKRSISQSAFETAKRFRVEDAVHLNNFEEIVSAIQLNWIVVAGIYVARDFGSLDSDGVSPVHRGFPNHAIHIDSFKFGRNGRPIVGAVNSWGERFGDKGQMGLVEEHFVLSGMDASAIRGTHADPNDPNVPPSIV